MNQTEKSNTRDAGQLRAILEHAHMPSLLNAMVHLTGDIECIRGDFRSTKAMLGGAQLTASESEKSKLLDTACELLLRWQTESWEVAPVTRDAVREMMNFVTGEIIPDQYTNYALYELSLTDEDRPKMNETDSTDNFHVSVIGAGMSGLLAAIRLQEAGIPFTVFEKNSDVGGTWFENRYPGCRVDSPNHVYSYSFAPHDWPQHFSNQKTLLSYFDEIAEQFNLKRHIRFDSEVKEMRYNTTDNKWEVTVVSDGSTETHISNSVITAVGQLNRPKKPEIEGASTFAGPSFHSAEWDHSVDLRGKKGLHHWHRCLGIPVHAGSCKRSQSHDGVPTNATVGFD